MERDEILSRLRERIVSFATFKLSREVVEDLAQEVLIVLHEKYRHVTELEDLLLLSFRILRYKMLESQRKSIHRGEQNPVAIEDLPLSNPGDNPGVEVERKQSLERLIEAMKQLSPRCRQLFRWKLEGKSFPEIQLLLGRRSINTVYTWDSRCRKRLLELMSGSWEGF